MRCATKRRHASLGRCVLRGAQGLLGCVIRYRKNALHTIKRLSVACVDTYVKLAMHQC